MYRGKHLRSRSGSSRRNNVISLKEKKAINKVYAISHILMQLTNLPGISTAVHCPPPILQPKLQVD